MKIFRSLRVAVLPIFAATSLNASDWSGTNGNWSSNSTPGWNGTGVPNAIGAVARHNGNFTSGTLQDIFSLTVGTIALTNNSDAGWSITNISSNSITLNQDGGGSGTATIQNSNTSATFNNDLGIYGNLILADDLLVSNTGASKSTTGAIVIGSLISGTGNITFRSNSSALSPNGAIHLTIGTNTFTGSVFVEKGTVIYDKARSFGNIANTVTLGAAGQGKASILASSNVTIQNPLIVASGAGDALTVGTTSSATLAGFAAPVTLNGDLTVDSTGAVIFYHNISGAGGIIKTNAGTLELTQETTFTGHTTLAPGSGSIGLSHTDALSRSTLDYTGSTVAFNSAVVSNVFTLGGLTGSANLSLQNSGSAAIALRVGGNDSSAAPYTGQLTGPGSLEKIGTGTLTLSRTGGHTHIGGTTVTAGSLELNNTSGSATGSGSVTVGSAGVLSGSFTLSGPATISGTLAPGPNATEAIGTANFGGNLTLAAGSTTNLELASAVSFDSINVTGTLTLTNTTTIHIVTIGGYVAQEGNSFHVIDWSVPIVDGGFDPETNLVTTGATLAPGLSWDKSAFLTTGTLTVVPEPGTCSLAMVGLLGVGAYMGARRRAITARESKRG